MFKIVPYLLDNMLIADFLNIKSEERIDALLNNNKPYDSNDLKDLKVNHDGLITYDEFSKYYK